MTKTRIQVRSADAEEAKEEGKEPPKPHKFHHRMMKHAGALRILHRVWVTDGFFGFYQVRVHYPSYQNVVR